MKKITILLILSIFFNSCKETKNRSKLNQYHIKGELKNLSDSTLIILRGFKNNSITIDSTYASFNKFSLKINKNDEDLFVIDFKNLNDSIVHSFDFWFENKDTYLSGDFNDKQTLNIEESKTNDLLREYRNILTYYDKLIMKAIENETNPKKIDEIFLTFVDSLENDQINLVLANPNNLFSVKEILRNKTKISKSKLKEFYNNLNENIKNSTKGKLIKKYLFSNQITIGEKYIDFEAIDLNGKKAKLSDYEGKIILLDFWAYWCTWCHVQNEKEFSYLNEKYKKDLVIISYSLDEKHEVWKKSTKKDSYKWTNISNLKGKNDPVTYMYKVKNLPHSFLINPKGIVINEFIGYEKDSLIEKEIKKILKKD
jgi:peroxiredoxin